MRKYIVTKKIFLKMSRHIKKAMNIYTLCQNYNLNEIFFNTCRLNKNLKFRLISHRYWIKYNAKHLML